MGKKHCQVWKKLQLPAWQQHEMNPEREGEQDDQEGEGHARPASSSRCVAVCDMVADALGAEGARVRREREARSPTRPVSVMIPGCMQI